MTSDSVCTRKQLLWWKVEQATNDISGSQFDEDTFACQKQNNMLETEKHARNTLSWEVMTLLNLKSIMLIFRQTSKKSSSMNQRESTLCSLVKHFDILWRTLVYCSALITFMVTFSPPAIALKQNSSCQVPLKNKTNTTTNNNKQPTWLNAIQHHASSGNYNKQFGTNRAS